MEYIGGFSVRDCWKARRLQSKEKSMSFKEYVKNRKAR